MSFYISYCEKFLPFRAGEALEFLEKYILVDDEMYDYEQNQLMAKMNVKHTEREAVQYKSLYSRTELLSIIGQKIISNLNISSIINIIDEEINKLIETDYFGIDVYEKEKSQIVYYFVGENKQINETVSLKETENSTFSAYCIKNKKDIIIGNLHMEYSKYFETYPRKISSKDEYEVLSMIYTPMIINDKVVGVMSVQSYKENAFNKDDLHTLKILANYSAIAIENAISYKKIEEIATYDHLTKFLSKHEIMKAGKIVFDKFKNNKMKFSVVMIDIDNFKNINDTYGHVYGDKALSRISKSIAKCIRNSDYIGRYGGDEFLLICPGIGKSEAVDVAERIRSSIENTPFLLEDDIKANITMSLGVNECNSNDNSFMDVVKNADKCLYYAKGKNRNIVICNN
ncbi:MAG: sensor domain-containing diguanylate cyclase [Sedimentibacter sp.]|uniref:sensor domain-containing diguanylate cyclase n=1 Tax=Sedimentibacter sp. TaxID=1960295 RepID=UPI002980CE03|nr:sensor domain-containing diguanylate cyclase [Sedimentibacter sp.]MDW5299104.1 sensor domain-containing diguanylate cyclase [Sedimentibacter sp.]